MTNRPSTATHGGLRLCLRWLDACRELGWDQEAMPQLEELFWKYHDENGMRKRTKAKEGKQQ